MSLNKKVLHILLIVSGMFISTLNSALADPPKKLFVVHSYELNHICGQPQHDGAMKAIKEAGWEMGKNLDIRTYHMNTKKIHNTPEAIREQGQKAMEEIRQYKPDVILTLDDNAFKNVALPMTDEQTGIVFCGMNGQPEDYNNIKKFMETRTRPGHNITGIYEKLHIREAIEVLANMLDLKKVLVLVDRSPTGRAIALQIKLEIKAYQVEKQLPCSIQQKTITSWEDFKKTIDLINSDPDTGAYYLAALLLKDGSGKTYTAPDIINYAVQQAKKPAIGPNYAFIKMGLYGGASVDFFAMGHQAGKKVGAILNGEDPGSLPIEDARRVALVFNLARAEHLGIKIPKDILLAADEVFRK